MEETLTVLSRARSSLDVLSKDGGLGEVHETVKNRHNRLSRAGSVPLHGGVKPPPSGDTDPPLLLECPSEKPLEPPPSKASRRSSSMAATGSWIPPWSKSMSTIIVHEMIRRRLTIDPESLREPMLEVVGSDAARAVDADLSRGCHFQRQLRTYTLPTRYAEQLVASISSGNPRVLRDNVVLRESPCSSRSDAVRRCTVLICGLCDTIKNLVVTESTSPRKLRLRYDLIVRVEVTDCGAVLRYCDDCMTKSPSMMPVPLIEVPLLEWRKSSSGSASQASSPGGEELTGCRVEARALVFHNRIINYCPRCTLLTERFLLRCAGDDKGEEWVCVTCNEAHSAAAMAHRQAHPPSSSTSSSTSLANLLFW